jgi:hypothetical protein
VQGRNESGITSARPGAGRDRLGLERTIAFRCGSVQIARLLRSRDLTPVHVPDIEDETRRTWHLYSSARD